MIDLIQKRLTTFRDHLIREQTRQEEAQKQLEELVIECKSLEQQQQIFQKVLTLLEQSNIVSRDFVKTEVEKLVTQGLRAIFADPNIEFKIDFVTKRNQTEADFVIIKGEKEQISGDILYTSGGGLVDIISISLRMIIMQLLKVKGPLLLDEPGKFISAQYIENFGRFLTQISKTFNRQIIMITHNEKLASFADNLLKVSQSNGIAKVKYEYKGIQMKKAGSVKPRCYRFKDQTNTKNFYKVAKVYDIPSPNSKPITSCGDRTVIINIPDYRINELDKIARGFNVEGIS